MFKRQRSKNSSSGMQNGDGTPPTIVENNGGKPPVSPVSRNTLQFYSQLAHGSPTAFVSGFSNVKELYDKIGECFDIPPSEVRKIITFP